MKGMKFRLRYAVRWHISFWTWSRYPMGYYSTYYDGWNNLTNLGLFCVFWITPPLIGDDL